MFPLSRAASNGFEMIVSGSFVPYEATNKRIHVLSAFWCLQALHAITSK